MHYANPARRRAYASASKRTRLARGWTKIRIDTRLTALENETAEDPRGPFNAAVTEVQNADSSSLRLEATSRIKLRAVQISRRIIEVSNHEQRIAALKEKNA
jgi:hypothetical protein